MLSPPSAFPKRRVLYIRHKRQKKDSPPFVTALQDEWPQALALHADVTVISEDFDYGEVCDRVNPDFVIYESGWLVPAPLTISNIHARSDIPRIALASFDPHDTARVAFFRQIDRMKIKWILGHMTEAMIQLSPELEGRLYSVSQFIDDAIFRDYGLTKDIPVSIFGGLLEPELYNWRAQTIPEIIKHFPTLVYKHPGYDTPIPRHRFPVVGEEFARRINRSHFSLVDTTSFDCVVRKHLEIPAAGAVLVAPDAASLKPYGFRDMQNCILGSGIDLYNKIAHVADNPDLYETIRKNGYDLVHSRYRRQTWRGVIDFYECLRGLKPGETVQQQGLLGSFTAVHGDTTTPAIAATYADSAFSSDMKKAQAQILRGEELDQAEATLRNLLLLSGHMITPCVPLAMIALLRGNLPEARKALLVPQQIRKIRDGLEDFDPVEIAFLSLTAALMDDKALGDMTRREAATMRHLSLRRTEWLGKILAAGGDASAPPADVLSGDPADRMSIHWMGQLAIDPWLTLIGRILAANGQATLPVKNRASS